MSASLRIMQMVDTLNPGGTERMCVNLANAFSENKIINAVAISRNENAMMNQINQDTIIYTGHKIGRWDLAAFKNQVRFVKTFQPNVIHAHSTTLLWAVMLKCRFPKIKIIWQDHLGARKQSNENWIIIILSLFISATIAVNKDIYEWHLKYLPLKRKFIKNLNNFSLFKFESRIPSSNTEIVYAASLLPVKNQMNLLMALQLLDQKGIAYHCKLAGKLADKTYADKLQNFIDQNNMQDKVTILGQVNDMSGLLAQTQIGIIASDSEGLPVSLLEYGLAKLAVVSTDVGACSEVLQNGQLGWIVPAKNPMELASAIEYIILHPEDNDEKAEKLCASIKANFGADKFMSAYLPLLNTLIGVRLS